MTNGKDEKLIRRDRWTLTNISAFVTLLAVIAIGGWLTSPSAVNAEEVTVYKNPSCGCCGKWAAGLRSKGHKVTEKGVRNMDIVKRHYGVGEQYQSCHTAIIGGYVIEGHVPWREIERLLRERPADAKGLAVPGMPLGSPGMEVPGEKPDSYAVMLLKKDGTSEVYAKY